MKNENVFDRIAGMQAREQAAEAGAQVPGIEQPKQTLEDVLATGRDRTNATAEWGRTLFKRAGEGMRRFGAKGVEYGQKALHGAMAAPELAKMGMEAAGDARDRFTETMGGVAERATAFTSGIGDTVEDRIYAATEVVDRWGESTAAWKAHKAEQVISMAKNGAEMTAAAALAAKDGTVELVSAGAAKVGEAYRGVQKFWGESVGWARRKSAEIAANLEQRRDEARMARLAEVIGSASEEYQRLLQKQNLKKGFIGLAMAA